MALISHFLRNQANQPTRLLAGYKTVASNVLDFSLPGDEVDTDDIVRAIILPVNAIVTSVKYEIIEGEGTGLLNITIGDGLVPTAWATAFDVDATPGTPGQIIIASTGLVPSAGQEKHYPQPMLPAIYDSIVLSPALSGLSNLKIWIAAEYYIKEVFENV